MLRTTRRRTLATFLQHELSRVGATTARDGEKGTVFVQDTVNNDVKV